MNKKRIFSLILSIAMLLQILALPVQAGSEHLRAGQAPKIQKSDGVFVAKNIQAFGFANTNANTERRSLANFFGFARRNQEYSLQSTHSTGTGATRVEKATINIKTKGLTNEQGSLNSFDWSAFGDTGSFKSWIAVKYVGDDKAYNATEEIIIDNNATRTVDVKSDSNKVIASYELYTEYQDAASKVKIRAYFGKLSPVSAGFPLDFTFDIQELVNTKIKYEYVDEYGDTTDENKPKDTDLASIQTSLGGMETPIKAEGEDNLRSDPEEFDEEDFKSTSVKFKLVPAETKDITIKNIKYLVKGEYNYKTGAKVTLQRQLEVVTPKKPNKPIPAGYGRIELIADEKAEAGKETAKGTFDQNYLDQNKRVVDVRAGVAYNKAADKVTAIGTPYPLNKQGQVDDGRKFKAWDPTLASFGTEQAKDKEVKTMNATYESTKDDIIPYLPTEEEPKTGKDGLPIPKDYVNVTFKSEDGNKGKVKIGEKEGEVVKAKVRPNLDLSKATSIGTKPADKYGFTHWTPELTKAADKAVYTAHFIKSGDEINPGQVTPKGWLTVTVKQDTESIKENTVKEASYSVAPKDKLASDKFVDIKNAAKDGYINPAWYVDDAVVEEPANKVITTDTTFIAKATETSAHKITKDGALVPVDITVPKGYEIKGDFWKKGVALEEADAKLQKILDTATVSDESGRKTDKVGTFSGTLKVTFKDGSSIEVKNQNLIVKGTDVTISFDKTAGDDANAPRAKEEVVKGKIKAVDQNTSVDGAIIVIKDKEDKIVGRGLANDDGSFVVGTKRPLIAGENLKITVTLPGVEKSSTPVDKQVKLNPDDLNKILPVGDKLYDNLKGKPGVSNAKLDALDKAVKAGYKLVPKAADQMAQKPAASVKLSDDGQKSLDNAAKAIKDAIKALTDNTAPVVTGTAFKEIFKGEDPKLEDGIEVKDADSTQDESDIAQQDGKDFSYKVYTTNSENQKVEVKGDALTNLNNTPGTYEVVYMAKDKSGAEGTFTMTLVVKDIVYTKIAVTTDPTAEQKYLVKDKDTKATPDYSGTVVTLTKNNGDTEEAKYDKATGKFKIGKKAINELTITPAQVGVDESPKTIEIKLTPNQTVKTEGNTELTAKANKAIIVQIDSDGNGVADTEENFDIAKAKTMEITNQPTLNYELDLKTGKASLDLKPLVVKVTDTLGNFKYFGYDEIKSDTKFALALGTENLTDKAAAKELTTADNGKKVKVTLTYKAKTETEAAKTLDAETSEIKVEDKRPNVIENPKDGETREGYVSVKFNAGVNGGLKGVNTFLVKKDTASSEVKAPTIVPAAGYKVKTDNGGWDKAIPAKFTADFTATAQYELDEATSETTKPGYTPITFDALDKGKIGTERTKTIYVNPATDVNLSEKAPTVTANTGYSFKAWDPAIDTAKKYTKEEIIIATYTSDELISDKKKAGYIKVTFDQGKHGKFNVTDPAQKTDYWVKPGTLVDLREKAPKVTADAGYIHTGWSPDLVVNYKAGTKAQTITAQYGLDSDYSTTEKAGYTKITFEKGTNGEFAQGAKTELWVNPAKELTIPAPGIVPHPGYSHTGWTKDNSPVNLSEKAKYTRATTITAAYESDISETEKTGYVKVSFDADKNGTIANDAKKDFWVNPNKEVNLTDKAPAVTPNSGYLFIKWDHKLVDTFNKATTIKATYASAGDIKTQETDGFTKVTFDAGTNGKFAEGAQVNYWVNPAKEIVLPEPRVIPNKGFEHTGWDKPLSPAKKYEQETTITATYKEEISTKPVEGHQEIKFVAGDDGTFADGKKEISIWVKPDTLVDLRKSAPAVTVTTEGKTFTGWDRDLVGSFAKSDQATVFKAQYAGSTSETPVPGWTEITFKSGDHGRFGTLDNTPVVEKKLWVDPKADVKLSDKAPKTIDDKNWSFDKWMDGENAATGLDQAKKYTEAKTYTASYESDLSDQQKEGFAKITFAPGTDGTFAQGATTETYVRKDKEVDIKDKAPKVTPKSGLSHKGWAIGNDAVDLTNIKVSDDTTITAQYTKAISDKPVDGWTRLQFNSGENGRFVPDAVTVKWVDPKVKLTLGAIAPGITPDKNYRLSAWTKPAEDPNAQAVDVDLETEQLFEKSATFTAKYEKISSDTKIEGFTKITFKSGEHGNFGTKENNPVKEKDIWVNPKSDVKLSEIAPELVIDTNWSFDKWMDGKAEADMNTANKYTAEKTLTATYESDFSDEAKKGFVKVEFKAGDHGKFEQINGVDQQTIVYVRKDKEIDITVKEPKVTPDNGYYFTGWDKPLQKIYTADTTHTGKNEKAIATEAVDGWTQITFNAGDKGLFKADAKTVIWVKPNTKIKLDDQVPGLEIEKGYSCIGWKKNAETNVTDLKVPATYDKSTTFTAAYESDFSKDNKEGFIEIKFKAGDNGNFGKTTGASSTEVKDYSVWVRPDKEIDLTDQAPEVTAHVGWKANGWDKEITKVTVKTDTAETDRTFTAQYVKDSDTSKIEKPGYKKITFKAGDHGTFANDAETVVYVNPDSEIELSKIAPKVNPAINYSFKAWNNGTVDVELTAKKKYTEATTYTAQYESDISDTAKDGFVEVKFDAGTDGDFKPINSQPQKTTFYVKKNKLVDLTDVAPTVTGKDKKTFTGWDSDLRRTFTDASTTINAKYTESISDKYVPGWTQLNFDQGDHGRFVKGQKNVKWVDPAVDLKLDDIAPKIKEDPNWSLKAWNDGAKDVDGTKAQKFDKETTFTAQYENAFSPEAKTGFVKVTFDKGAHGKFVKEAVTEIYVKKDVELDLREKAPTVIPNQGWGHKGWIINGNANDLSDLSKVIATGDTTITPYYVEGKFDADKITEIMVLGPTQMGYGVGEKLNLDGLKVIAIDDAGLQKTYEYNNGELIHKIDESKSEKLNAKIKVADAEVTFKEDQGKKTVTTELAMDDNDKHIVVTKGALTGQTITTLKIHENKSAKAENVKALNQNEVGQDGKPTDKAKTTTTVTGKVKKDATVKILDKNNQDITPTDTSKLTVDQYGNFTAEVTHQNEGDKIQVIATEKGKQPSEPADAIVARDANNDGEDDSKANQKTDTPTAEAFNQNIVENDKVTKNPKTTTTITGKAEKGAKVVAKATIENKEVIVGTTTSDAQTGEYTIEATKTGQPNGGVLDVDTEVKVTAQVTGKLVSDATATVVRRDADNNKKDDKAQDFDIKKATKVEIVENPTKMDYLVKDNTSKTKFETAGLVIKITDAAGKEIRYTASELKNMTDKITVEPADQAEIGVDKNNTKLKVTVKGSDLTEKPSVESTKLITVQIDADDSGTADKDETTTITSVMARNIGTGTTTPKTKATFTTIEGVAEKGSTVTIKFTPKAEEGQTAQEVTKTVKADADTGAYKLELKAGENGLTSDILLPAETEVKASAKFGDKEKSNEISTKVFEDLDADGKNDKTSGNVTERPSALASNIGRSPAFTTIEGEGEKGATITAKAKVNDQEVVVGTATVGSDGKYTIQATIDVNENGQTVKKPLKQGTLVSVTAKLDPKGESAAQITHVFNDSDNKGQPDSSKDFNIKQAVKMEVVASPDKMVYNNGEKLNLNGLRVLITDVNGNQKIYKYEHNADANKIEFIKAGLSVDLKQETVLSSKDYNAQTATDGHNGRKLVVTLDTTGNTAATTAITGETPTALEVNKDQTAKPTDVTAANQGTDTATKVRFKAADGATIKIYKSDDTNKTNLIDGTPVAGTGKDAGYLIATLNTKLDEGTWIEITAQETGKKESSPEQAKVIRDKNSNWEGGKTIKLTPPVISPIRENNDKVTIDVPKAEDKIKTIEVTDGTNTVTLTKDATGNTWTVNGSNPVEKVTETNNKIEIPKGTLTLKAGNLITVTFKDGENPANEAFDKAVVQKASQKPIVDQVYTGEKEVKIADPTIADDTATTIEIKVNDVVARTVKKENGVWKVPNDPNAVVNVVDNKVVVPLNTPAKLNDEIKVTTTNDSNVKSPEAEVKVEDKKLTKKPTIDKANKDENTVSGTAAPGAKITVTVTPKGGEPKKYYGEADNKGNYEVTTKTLVDGDKVVATASEPGKADNTSDEKIVGVDTSKLKESIDKADPIAGEKDKDTGKYKNLDETKPIDKELKDALDNGKNVKDLGDKNDSSIDQDKVDEAKKALDKAIAQKEADTAVDKAKEEALAINPNAKPEEKEQKLKDLQDSIDKAQEKINEIPGTVDNNPTKKELQEKLELIKAIKDGEDRLSKDDVTGKEGEPQKPEKQINDLKEAVKNGKDALEKEKGMPEATEDIRGKLKLIDQEQVVMSVERPTVNTNQLVINTLQSNVTLEITINGAPKGNGFSTNAFGEAIINFTEYFTDNQEVIVTGSKKGLLPVTITVKPR